MPRSLGFTWRGGPAGVLLVHGLTGTPTEMRFVARGLHNAGFTVHAGTDVTGFGLLGHAFEMADGSGVTAEFSVSRIPLLSQARRPSSVRA